MQPLLSFNNRHISGDDDGPVPAAITDTGCERELNEDRYAVVESPSGLVWILCDGMGGVTGGELAAQLAIEAMRRELESNGSRPVEIALQNSIIEANRVISLRRQNPAFSSMGTTVVSAIFMGTEVAIAHIGDSRAYLVRDFSIQQLTHDHTLVQEMVDRGQLKFEEALSHPQAHVLTKCLGSEPGLLVTAKKYWIWETSPDEVCDILLLCSDGLYSHVSDAEIATITSRSKPQSACVELVELAKSRGGFDNISVVIIPLAGQLKKEPPVGFNAQNPKALQNKKKNRSKLSWTMTVLASLFLGFIASLLTVIYFYLVFSMTKDNKPDDPALRARNRTVMLTPDITDEVRNRLISSSATGDSGFVSPAKNTIVTPQSAENPNIDVNQPLVGFLVSFDNGPQGEYFELRAGRKIITSDANSQGNNLLIEHPTVSPMHAILRVTTSGVVQVLDQLSEHGTSVTKAGSSETETLSGEKANLEHGDKIQFGERSFWVCIIYKD